MSTRINPFHSRQPIVFLVLAALALFALWAFERSATDLFDAGAGSGPGAMAGSVAADDSCIGCHQSKGMPDAQGRMHGLGNAVFSEKRLANARGLEERHARAGGLEEHYSRIRGDGLPPRAPNSWFYNQRAYPNGRIPLDQWRDAQEQAALLKANNNQGRAYWFPRGPTNIGGRITDIVVDPTNEDIVYAGGAEGGVFRSVDGGQNWTALFDNMPSLAIGALAIDPQNHEVILAGTGEVNPGGGSVAYGGTGLYRSDDQGATWTHLGLDDSGAIGRIRIDPNDSDTIFVAAMGYLWETNPERGVYRTTNGGATWERVLYVNDTTGCVDLIMRPDDPDVILAAMWERIRQPEYYSYGGINCAVWRTQDGGENWSILGGGLPTPTADSGRIGLSLCNGQPSVMHAVYADKTGYFDGLYRSTDGGDSWTRTNDSSLSYVFASYGWWFGNVRTHPVDPDTIFVLGLYFYRSTNGGASYSDASGIMHVDHHGLDFGPGLNPVIYNGNDGGVYKSTNGGTGWDHMPNLAATQIYRVALDANNANALYCGAQDNGTNRTLTGALDDWVGIYGGDGFQPLIHPENSSRIWAQYQYGALNYSSNNGVSWTSATDGISYSDRFNWNSPFIQDPVLADRRYFGTNKVYRSQTNTSWTVISPDLTEGPHMSNPGQVTGTLTTLAVSPLDNNVIWAGSDDGLVHVTVNGGTVWNDVSTGLPDRWITSVRADPFDRETAYVTVSGFRWAEPLPHVFKTVNMGATWDPIAGNLPEAPVNDFLPDPAYPGRYFIATDVGVFETMDSGANWNALGVGLPNVVVTSMALNESSRTLYAGTYGRSFFSTSVALQPGDFIPYGEGLAGSGGYVPDLSGSGTLLYGEEVTVTLDQGLGGAHGIVYVGLNPSSIPILGGTFLVHPILIAIPITLTGTPGVPGTGGFSTSFSAELWNVSIYVQMLFNDPGAVKGVSFSNGLELEYP